MRVVQLIDSLNTGGSERMAVNIANNLSGKVDFSGLVVTRKEGELKSAVFESTPYLFLDRKKMIDITALVKFKTYIKENRVAIIHAHSSSLVFAVMIKICMPQLKIVWHDHYGNSEFLSKRSSLYIKLGKYFISTVISVNDRLKNWAVQEMKIKNVFYIPNFAVVNPNENPETNLKGKPGKRIVCLANYRPQKDLLNLINAFEMVVPVHTDWTLHLIGKDNNDEYALYLREQIESRQLQDKVFLYGSKKDTGCILSQASIGVLASRSEGLPLALLEYGLAKLPVVVTNVGQCADIVENGVSGFLVEKENAQELKNKIIELIDNDKLRIVLGGRLHHIVSENYGVRKFMNQLVKLYEES